MSCDQRLIGCGIRPLRDKYLPLSPVDLCQLEKEWEPFPSAYRTIILKYGCAVFDKEVYFVPCDRRFREIAPDGRSTLDLIYGAVYDNDPWDPHSLRANIENMKGRIPDTMIPIACSGNDHVCLGLVGSDRNKIFYWDREGGPTADYNNVYLIADTFDDFANSLRC